MSHFESCHFGQTNTHFMTFKLKKCFLYHSAMLIVFSHNFVVCCWKKMIIYFLYIIVHVNYILLFVNLQFYACIYMPKYMYQNWFKSMMYLHFFKTTTFQMHGHFGLKKTKIDNAWFKVCHFVRIHLLLYIIWLYFWILFFFFLLLWMHLLTHLWHRHYACDDMPFLGLNLCAFFRQFENGQK